MGAVVNRRSEENLIAHLRVGREELPFLLVILRRPSAASAAGTLRLAKQPQGVLITERGHKAPVHEHIAPFVAVLLAVVPLRVLFVEVSGVLCPVRTTGVGSLVVELTVGRLFDVAEFADCDGDHSGSVAFAHSRHSFLGRGVGGVLIVELLAETGAAGLRRLTLVCRPLEVQQDAIGCSPHGLRRFQCRDDDRVALQLVPEEIELHLQVADALALLLGKVEQVLLPTPICPLRQTVAGAIFHEVLVRPVVHRSRVGGVGEAEGLLVAVLQVGGNQAAFRIQVPHQTGNPAIG